MLNLQSFYSAAWLTDLLQFTGLVESWFPLSGHVFLFLICFFSFPAISQSQHSHLVIQQLLGHLDANSKNSAKVRAGIVEVLLEAAAIAASGSVGE